VFLENVFGSTSSETELKLIQKNTGTFRGYITPLYFLLGVPNIDTLLMPIKCQSEGCISYKQARSKYLAYQSCIEDVLYYLSEQNQIFINGRKEPKVDLTFDPPEGRKPFNFKGTLIE
jgi:hypothetical protein